MKIDREALLHTSRHFCMLPWSHLYLAPSGDMGLCCLNHGKSPARVDDETTIEQAWNSDRYREVRLAMLEDKPVRECQTCYRKEATGWPSYRTVSNISMARHFDLVEKTCEDGSLPRLVTPYIDIRLSNICNLRCRTCGPMFSSNWYDDAKVLGYNGIPSRILRPLTDPEAMWTQIEALLPHVEEFYFAGGEPLLTDEHYRVLQWLIDHDRTDVRIRYSTNLSVHHYKKLDVHEMWRQFSDVQVSASIDAFGPKADYVRKGASWDTLVSNRRRMIEVCPNVEFMIGPTISVFNFLDLPTLHRTMVEDGLLDVQGFFFNPLYEPAHYSLNVVPDYLRDQALYAYTQHLDWLLERTSSESYVIRTWSTVRDFIKEHRHDPTLLKEFQISTNTLDALRQEKFVDVFPELAFLLAS